MKRPAFDRFAVDAALASAERVVTHRALRELGVPTSTMTRWIGPHGPWQRLLPGVVLAHRGIPTRRELLLGALAFAGPAGVITGPDALRALGVRSVGARETVHVLVPLGRQKASFGYAYLDRTSRLPQAAHRRAIPFAPPARATIDTCRRTEALAEVRAVVSAVVQQGFCEASALVSEMRMCPRQRTAGARQSLLEVSAGIRSVAEGKAQDTLRRFGLPEPLWNVPIRDDDGVTILTPDAWWPEHGAAMEIDSVAWHLSPDAWRRTQRRQRLMTIAGLRVLSFSPLEITDDPEGFARQVAALLGVPLRRR